MASTGFCAIALAFVQRFASVAVAVANAVPNAVPNVVVEAQLCSDADTANTDQGCQACAESKCTECLENYERSPAVGEDITACNQYAYDYDYDYSSDEEFEQNTTENTKSIIDPKDTDDFKQKTTEAAKKIFNNVAGLIKKCKNAFDTSVVVDGCKKCSDNDEGCSECQGEKILLNIESEKVEKCITKDTCKTDYHRSVKGKACECLDSNGTVVQWCKECAGDKQGCKVCADGYDLNNDTTTCEGSLRTVAIVVGAVGATAALGATGYFTRSYWLPSSSTAEATEATTEATLVVFVTAVLLVAGIFHAYRRRQQYRKVELQRSLELKSESSIA